MTDEPYDTTRRHILKIGAGGLAALAGCTGTHYEDDPNPHDYPFVEGKDLAERMYDFEGDKVKTHTSVRFVDRLNLDGPNKAHHYEAHPPDTVHTFPLMENVDGDAEYVVQDALGDEFHEDSYTDVLLEVYGQVKEMDDDGPATFQSPVLLASDARRVQEGDQ